jgi:hypothetical protein
MVVTPAALSANTIPAHVDRVAGRDQEVGRLIASG